MLVKYFLTKLSIVLSLIFYVIIHLNTDICLNYIIYSSIEENAEQMCSFSIVSHPFGSLL